MLVRSSPSASARCEEVNNFCLHVCTSEATPVAGVRENPSFLQHLCDRRILPSKLRNVTSKNFELFSAPCWWFHPPPPHITVAECKQTSFCLPWLRNTHTQPAAVSACCCLPNLVVGGVVAREFLPRGCCFSSVYNYFFLSQPDRSDGSSGECSGVNFCVRSMESHLRLSPPSSGKGLTPT